jgi:hypothetical protein
MIHRRVLVAFLLSLAACTTRKYMLSRPLDSGFKAVYESPFDKVKRASYDVLAEVGFSVKDERWDERAENAWVINSSQGLSAGTVGRYARIVIQKTDREQTVFVLVESKAATREAAASDEDTAKSLLARIEKRLNGK